MPGLGHRSGDTTSALAAAEAADAAGIAVAHVEAGLRSFDLAAPFPEERNRIAIARLAALHFAPTALARDNLLAEGIAAGAIEVTGNTIVDALRSIVGAAAPPATSVPHLVVATFHRRENRPAFAAMAAALARLARRADIVLLVPGHPSSGEAVHGPLRGLANVELSPPMPYARFVRRLALARLVITDSGGIQEEASALGVPTLIARNNTERPEVVVAGTARVVGTRRADIFAAAALLLDDDDEHRRMARRSTLLGDGRAADRIADRLLGAAQSSAAFDCSWM